MHTVERVWMTPQTRESLERELAELLAVPNEGGTDEVVDAWLARKERIREIHELLSRADHAVAPADDGVAEPGMVLTVRFDDSGDTETFLLGTRGTTEAELEVYTVNSPLGGALLGATPGQQRSYQLPNGATQTVTLLSAKPFGTDSIPA
ncbi:transcription elongation factor GreA [Mycolicibacterium parafortuitum]|uniref:Transcription elongation factor GreA n=1 Tax=Mycolicibacterium parafortuitum TaxID=39692 RepID=A0A7I7U2X8_MYCPF|nr:GreA/GreB family elongation factor [Mycolicibacterium parafortuitum]PQD99379.1 hypothetical protein CYL16_18390 [Mycobacterium sp. EPG1]BBY75694.1 transcription elongation factor GreA [Mycolicibacterium parafortuitum]